MLETIENILIDSGAFKLKQITQMATKTNNGNRLDAIYTKSYSSSKYNSISTLERMTIKFNSYLVFSIFNKDNNSMEEVYFSVPHLTDVKNFLKETIEFLFNKASDIYTKNDINQKYSDLTFESPTLISGKKIAIIPQKIKFEDFYEDGIIIFANDDDHFAELTLNNFLSLYEIINDFKSIDFNNMAHSSFRTAAIKIILDSSSGTSFTSSDKSSSYSRSSSNNTRTPFNRSNKPKFSRKSNNETEPENIDEILDEDDNNETQVEEQPTKFKRRKVSEKSEIIEPDNDKEGISLNDIMKTAEKINADDLDIEGDITFD